MVLQCTRNARREHLTPWFLGRSRSAHARATRQKGRPGASARDTTLRGRNKLECGLVGRGSEHVDIADGNIGATSSWPSLPGPSPKSQQVPRDPGPKHTVGVLF